MQFEWSPIIKGNSAGLLAAEKLSKSKLSIEEQLAEWLTTERSVRICSGETTGFRRPSVCIVYEENQIELGEAEMLLSDFTRCNPTIAPVTNAFSHLEEISQNSESSEKWFEKRDERSGVFWDSNLCVQRAELSGAIDVAFSYATAYTGEANFKVPSKEEAEIFLEGTDPASHPAGKMLKVYYNYQDPRMGKGFSESVTVFLEKDLRSSNTNFVASNMK